MSGLFGSKKEEPTYTKVYDPFEGIRNKTSSWLESQIGKTAEPYTGQMVAPMSAQETQSLGALDKYATQAPSEQTTLAQNEIKKTLTGEYDPTTSPYYQAVKAEAARNLQDTLGGVASDAAGGGRYWTGARLGQQREARTDVANSLNTMLGGLSENERQNRLTAAQQAQSLGLEETEQPLKQATALQALGGLPRQLGQAQNEATYNEWLRQQEYPIQMAQMAQPYATSSPTYAQSGYSASPWTSALSGIGSGIGSAASNLLSGLFNKKTTTSK